MVHDGLAAWLRLFLTPGLGRDSARKLLAAFGLPEAIFAASADALRQVVRPLAADAVLAMPDNFAAQWATTQAWLAAADPLVPRRIVTLGDAGYPASLLQMEDPPLLLFLLGRADLAALDVNRSLAVVGSRNPTRQGEENARQFAKALAHAGITIVSGMALGVDGAAHEGALDGAPKSGPSTEPDGLGQVPRTVAVVGTGLDRVYPRQHLDLAHRIAAHGLLVSEYPLGTPPLSNNFPRRNRIIAGLARATLVVEAALKSGSLITARLASEQGKDVLAIPGSIHATQSRGCHALIKQGAKLVESAQDVLEEFGDLSGSPRQPAKDAPSSAGSGSTGSSSPHANEASLLAALGFDPVGLDALQARTGLDTAHLQAHLLTLELDGQVARLPGGLFQRCGAA